jgi:hypothetical protein
VARGGTGAGPWAAPRPWGGATENTWTCNNVEYGKMHVLCCRSPYNGRVVMTACPQVQSCRNNPDLSDNVMPPRRAAVWHLPARTCPAALHALPAPARHTQSAPVLAPACCPRPQLFPPPASLRAAFPPLSRIVVAWRPGPAMSWTSSSDGPWAAAMGCGPWAAARGRDKKMACNSPWAQQWWGRVGKSW